MRENPTTSDGSREVRWRNENVSRSTKCSFVRHKTAGFQPNDCIYRRKMEEVRKRGRSGGVGGGVRQGERVKHRL